MDRNGKQQFMGQFDNMRDMHNKNSFKDRQDDDEKREKYMYWMQNDTKRMDIDKQMDYSSQMRDYKRTGVEAGGIGSSCMPGKRGRSNSPGQSKGGMGGPGGPGGMMGKKRMLQEAAAEPAAEAAAEPAAEPAAEGAGPEGAKPEGPMGGPGGMNMMKEMMGGMGMEMMDKDGMMKGGMGQKMGQFGGKAGTELMGKMIDGMKGGMGGMQMGGSCGQGMCCGSVMKSGKWSTDFVCNKESAGTF